MKRLLCLLIPLFTTTALQGSDFEEIQVEDDFSRLETLIEVHQENLEREKSLKALLSQYKKLEKHCIQHAQDVESMNRFVEVGNELHNAIQELALQDYFRPQLLEELKRVAKMHQPQIPPVR